MRLNRYARAPSTKILSGLLIATLLVCNSVSAQVPHLIRYQGQAMDSKGVPLEGPYTLTFRLYDAQTAGTKLWEETQPNVQISKGHFSVLLGQVTPLKSMDWNKPCWLSVQVGTELELTPRQQITSVPLAIVAERLSVPVTTSTITDDAKALVPSGAIILWDGASCPAGYTRLAIYDDRFLVGSATAGTTGGSNTHNHGGSAGNHTLTIAEMPSHTHAIVESGTGSSGSGFVADGSGSVPNTDVGAIQSTGGGAGHSHTISSADNRPAFRTILLCKKD